MKKAAPRKPKHLVFLLDADIVARRWLGRLIESEPALCVCGEASAMDQALSEIPSARPDAVVIDVDGPDGGPEAVSLLRRAHPALPVVAVSMREGSVFGRRILRAGAAGYVTKAQAALRIIPAIRRALNTKGLLGRPAISGRED
jgi:two-component system, NarL family, invasion response regulator UvrY